MYITFLLNIIKRGMVIAKYTSAMRMTWIQCVPSLLKPKRYNCGVMIDVTIKRGMKNTPIKVVGALSRIVVDLFRVLKPHPGTQSHSNASVSFQTYMCKCISMQTGSTEKSFDYSETSIAT